MADIDIENFVEVGISARDRWEHLSRAIEKTNQFFSGRVRIRVVLDGPGTRPFERLQGAEINTSTERLGYIVRRNQLVASCRRPYYLSLDDDSYPERGDLMEAVRYMEANRHIAVLGFPIQRPDGSWQVASASVAPYQTRSFVGCAHLLRADVFRDLGGYLNDLVHQGEESQYGAVLLRAGYQCQHFPGVIFVHEAASVARSHSRIGFYAARNKMIWACLYCPGYIDMIVKLLRGGLEQTWYAMRELSVARVRGLADGLHSSLRLKSLRRRMTPQQYSLWCRLPYY